MKKEKFNFLKMQHSGEQRNPQCKCGTLKAIVYQIFPKKSVQRLHLQSDIHLQSGESLHLFLILILITTLPSSSKKVNFTVLASVKQTQYCCEQMHTGDNTVSILQGIHKKIVIVQRSFFSPKNRDDLLLNTARKHRECR